MKLSSKGQTLIEVMVVITVGLLIVGGLTFAIVSSLRNAQLAKNQAQGTKLAQEGVEKARLGRDRGDPITGGFTVGGSAVDSWLDPDLWSGQISASSGSPCPPPQNCYFKLSATGLQFLGGGSDIPAGSEDPLGDGRFKRAVILSDESASASFSSQKKLTVIVRWSDFSGNHESKLVTYLRKL